MEQRRLSEIIQSIAALESSSEEAFLLLTAKGGDAKAFVELCQRHSSPILYRLHRMTGCWEDAEDAFQDSILRAYQHIHDFQNRSKFSTWLTRIAINCALMMMRKRYHHFEVSFNDSFDSSESTRPTDFPDTSVCLESALLRQETIEHLHRCVLRLKPRHREVVELYLLRDCSISEIAQKMGITPAATKSRLLRARIALRDSMNRPRRSIGKGSLPSKLCVGGYNSECQNGVGL